MIIIIFIHLHFMQYVSIFITIAAFKASLFMITGIIDHSFHSRDIEQLRGLRVYMPLGFILSAIAGFSMAGIPPLSGFYSKEYFLTAVYSLLSSSMLYMIIVVAVVIAALGTAVYSLILAFKPQAIVCLLLPSGHAPGVRHVRVGEQRLDCLPVDHLWHYGRVSAVGSVAKRHLVGHVGCGGVRVWGRVALLPLHFAAWSA